MHCIDGLGPLIRPAAAVLVLLLAGCASAPPAPHAASASAPAAAVSPRPTVTPPPAPAAAAAGAEAAGPEVSKPKAPPRYVKLGPPNTPRSWDELRLQAAQRMVAAHPDTSYVGTPPSILLAIPILEIELNADGSVRYIKMIRVPGQAQDTLQLAIAAVHRAAPYGDVSRLKKPWKFMETFLFDDDRRFMPRLLDR